MPKPYSDPARKAWPLFLLFVLVGLGFMTPFVMQAVRDYRIAKVYEQTSCDIVSERAVTMSSHSTLGGRWVESQSTHTEYTWRYAVNGLKYTAEGYDNHDGIMADFQETGNLQVGAQHECWYDPVAPEKSVLVRHFRAKFYLGALIPGSFILIGGVFLRGALRRKPAKTDADISKGDRLRYRLSPVVSTRGILGCLGVAIIVVGLVTILVLPKISVGQAGGLLTGDAWKYIIALGLEGFLIYHLLRNRQAALVPDPIVEINDEPLAPGQTTQLYIHHPGPAQLASLQVQVICEKVGTGTRVAHKHLILERKALRISQSEDFLETFTIPAKAPPSLKTVQTVTNWCIRVRRKLVNNVSYDTDYPFHVETRGDGKAPD